MLNVLSDLYEETLLPVLRLKPLFALADGIFSPLQRANGECRIVGHRSALFYKDVTGCERIVEAEGEMTTPGKLIGLLGEKIEQDISLLDKNLFTHKPSCSIVGNTENIWVHKSAKVSSLCELDATGGPVIIDEGAKISAFSLLRGPVYIGKHSVIDKAFISSSRAGTMARLGGEISDSLIGSFTNKHHEGFLGHSIVGDWVNLGALTTTSDLKNNYGEIRLTFENRIYSSGRIKLGSIIGDYVKTGIGTMLGTGTIIDFGSQLFTGRKEHKYYPPFFWGGENATRYQLERFLSDASKIMARRKQEMPSHATSLIRQFYSSDWT